ncbi:potassium channel family protein [Marisediminicola sp. LYQ85]|uniref:potassium channel family protein n=1 Tax=Marisediminicola sp. LYQ85 TaxID=3391062 RepID=UPI0039831727
MDLLFTSAGAVLVVLGLLEVFRTLLHPEGRGRLSRRVASGVWRVVVSFGRPARAVAGPIAIVAVFVFWSLLQVVGWALIYLPHVPEGFSYDPGLDPAAYPPFLEAVYFSSVALATLGLGDVIAADPWIRYFAPAQAIIGFALITAIVSWLMQLYPALLQRRSLALQLTVLKRSDLAGELRRMHPATASSNLDSITSALTSVTIDLVQATESFFFSERSPAMSLPARLPYVRTLTAEAKRSRHRAVRSSGAALDQAVAAFAEELGDTLGFASTRTDDILDEYSRRHGGGM